MMRLYSMLILAIICISCSDNCVKTIKVSESTDTLNLKALTLPYELLMPTRMLATSDQLIVYQRKGDDVLISINISDDIQQKVIGRKGRGPKEFTSIDVQSLKPTNNGFVCMDAGGKLNEVIMGDDIEITSRHISTYGHPQNGIILKSGFLSANIVNENSEYIFYTEDSDEPAFLFDYPDWTEDKAQPLSFTYMKNMVSHPTEDKFAAFYINFRKLRILDSQGKLHYDIDVQVPNEFPVYSSDSPRRNLAYASYPYASDQYIYALCLNTHIMDMLPEIHIWDWNGNLKKRLILDNHIDILAVDEDKSVLYGINVNSADTLYYQYFNN